MYTNQKIVITGGNSFLGGYLVNTASQNYQVFATYHQNNPRYPGITWIPVDLSKKDTIQKEIKKIQPDLLIHNAALTNVDLCEQQREQTQIVNIQASEYISKLCSSMNCRIFYISTDLVFDGDSPPYSENDQPNPVSFYGWSKWQAEQTVAAHNPNHVIIRPAIMYGPPKIAGTSFSEWMKQSWQDKKTTNLFIDQYRTPIYAGNLADAIVELASREFTGILNLAGSERINRYEFGINLAKQLNLNKSFIQSSKMADSKLTGKRPLDVSLNIDKATKLLHTKFLDCQAGIKAAYRRNLPSS